VIVLKELAIAAAQADASPATAPTTTVLNLAVPRSAGLAGPSPKKLRIGLIEPAATATIEIWGLVEKPVIDTRNLGNEVPAADRRFVLVAPSVALAAADELTDVAGDVSPGAYFIRVVASTADATLVVIGV